MSRRSPWLVLLALTAASIASSQIISPPSLPSTPVGASYSQTLISIPGSVSTTWSLVSGSLPPGLSLTVVAGNAVISGQGTQTGASTFLLGAKPPGFTVPFTAPYTIIVSPMFITTTTLPDGIAGVQYGRTLILTGGFSPYTWSFGPGTVANGLAIESGSGFILGTPVAAGSFPINVTVTDSGTPANTATRSYTWIVTAPPAISTSSLPAGEVGIAYSQTLAASGGTLPYVWSLAAGSTLPPGLTLNGTSGLISGTPTAAGTYPVTVQLSDAFLATASRALSITVQPALSITTTTLSGGVVGSAYSQTLQSSRGVAPIAWNVSVGVLPPGLTLSSSGVISGTPTAQGSQTFTVTATDALGATATRPLTLQITTLAITTITLPQGTLGSAYVQTLQSSGGAAPITWNVSVGTLPPGLTLNSSGVISGTPTAQGSQTFTVTATDALGATATRPLTLQITTLAITTTTLPGGAVGSAYSQTLQSSGGVAPISWNVSVGTLPPGLTLNSSGVISGTPTAEGSQTFTVLVTDSLGAAVSRPFTLQITTLTITTTALPDGTQSSPYSTALAAAGGTGLTWSVSAGSLPGGLLLGASTGAITGTPINAGTSTFTISVTSANPAAAASKQFSITIAAAPPPPIPSSVTMTVPGTPGPAQQPALTVALGSSYPLEITANVTLTFSAEGSGADNPEARFSNSTRTASVKIAAGSTASDSGIAILTGTVGGTITLTAQLIDAADRNVTPTATPVRTIVISQGVPVITSARILTVSGGFNFVVTGYSATREVSSGTFRFTPTSGTNLTASEFTVPLTSAFTAWYNNTQSANTGSQFKLTIPFQVSGTTLPIAAGTAQLTNARGASAISAPAIPLPATP